ncbi:hypothetical protein PWT90_01886 [Aphanocladium album]|nr:hypothetical protein PWT90_01886 [Aphanocladium album]
MHSFVALSLLTLAAATPVPSGGACSNPAAGVSSSEGFNLRIKVADPTKAKLGSTQVDGAYITIVHVGAGINMVTPGDQTAGTDGALYAKGNTVVTGFDQTSLGWNLAYGQDNKDVAGAYLNFGPGTEGVTVVDDGKGGVKLGPKQYMVCDEHIPYGLAVEMTNSGAVPSNCVAVTLVPECAPTGSGAKGQKIAKSRCMKPVKA